MAKPDLTLDGYQAAAAATDIDPESSDSLVPLLGLAGEVGALAAEFKKQHRLDGAHYSGFDDGVATELGDILWYLAALARRNGLSLEAVARLNLAKTADRWLPPSGTTRAFDGDFPPDQQLPRQFDVVFERTGENIRMLVDGETLGDPIDDNSHNIDGYRFHDVFHLAYAAVLGWSPILRSLLRRKRKSEPAVDRVEDGARACVTEEAIAALVFKMAANYGFFLGYDHVDDSVLRAVTAVASGLEVETRTKAEWERAILEGFAAWRGLREQGQGRVRVDLDARTVRLGP